MAQGLFTLRQQVQGIVQKAWNTPVGTYAGSFNGSSQYLSLPSIAAYTLSADFTIEFWVNATSYSSTGGGSPTVLSGTNTLNNWLVLVDSGTIAFYWNQTEIVAGGTTNIVGSWFHVAIVRSGSTVTIYKNGTRLNSATNASSFTLTSPLFIGQQNTGVGYWAGLISNVRIVKGTALYTQNFAPPAAPLAAITNTSLLTLQNVTIIDNSTNAATITNGGSVTTIAAMPFTQLTTPAVDYLVVAGGGGGGVYWGGGGGAGGLLQGSVPVTTGSAITVTVGGGGTSSNASFVNGGNGVNSVFGNISATGGAGGMSYASGVFPTGGSGSGGTTNIPYGTQGTFGQGNAGGAGAINGSGYQFGGGGGGAGTKGLDGGPSGNYGGNGGAGIASAISGTVTAYAGGGGGAGNTSQGTGGVGGGGTAVVSGAANAGSSNTGGGGGGQNTQPSSGTPTSGAGGSGIVIVSYPDIYAAAASTTGSPTVSTSGSGSIYTNSTYIAYPNSSAFTLSGDYTIEGWFNVTNISASPNIFCLGSSTSGTYGILLYYSNATSSLKVYSGGGAIIAGPTIANNVWYHFAIVRSGSGSLNTVLYLNGTSVGSVTNNYSFTGITANGFCVAAEYGSSFTSPSTNYVSNIRITKSVLYIGSFTPSTIPLAVVTNTSFLLNATSGAYLNDGASGLGPTLYSTSGTTWNQSSPFATGLGYKNRVYTWASSSGTITF
jgi:hypothetical protein